jgi:protein tyrosine/serine phosphatase
MSRQFSNVFAVVVVLALIAAPVVFAVREQAQARGFRVVRAGVLYRSGQLSEEGLRRAVHDYGIRTVVSLRHGNRPTDQAEEDYCRREEINFVRLPPLSWDVKDGAAPVDENVRKFLEVMADPRNHPVLIHCFAGTHRTGLYCAVYRMEFEGWDLERALAEMRSGGYVEVGEHADVLGYLYEYRPGRLAAQPAARGGVAVRP